MKKEYVQPQIKIVKMETEVLTNDSINGAFESEEDPLNG